MKYFDKLRLNEKTYALGPRPFSPMVLFPEGIFTEFSLLD